jgi:hypothetical protein
MSARASELLNSLRFRQALSRLMPRIAHIVSTARYLPQHDAELAARFTALGDPNG